MTQNDFERLLVRYNVSIEQFIRACHVLTIDTPPYIERTIRAIAQGKKPADMSKFSVPALCEFLQADKLTVRRWMNADCFPMTARLAMATVEYKIPLIRDNSLYHIKILRSIEIGSYRQAANLWRSGRVMGKCLKDIRNNTVDAMRLRGYVTLRGKRLQLTARGKKYVYKSR